ncbi:glycosyltransferase family 2 protein [Methylobacterium sp. J-076]|uniref:glycosyltransferase family 2 protein n=1 Tax=Methylobacterium sp. J-076 TaxID=2836655 RepID=UPI001FBB0B03|nr:glycosyltransferase [Methylobacterium sp. J-076]
MSFSADALAAPGRPVLRIVRSGGEVQVAVLPGPALGRAHWIGLIPDDATEILLSTVPGTILERVGRRSEASIVLECAWHRPGNALAALHARVTGQARRVRDTLRGGVAVTRQRQFARWASPRSTPFTGPVPDLAIRCIVLARPGQGRGLSRTLASLANQSFAPAVTATFRDPADGGTGAAWDPVLRPADLLEGADALCLLHAGDELAPDALALLAASLGGADLAYGDEIGPDDAPRLKPDWSADLAVANGYVGRVALLSRGLIARMSDRPLGPVADAAISLGIAAALACRRAVHCPRPLGRIADLPSDDDRARRLLATGIPLRGVPPDRLWPLPEPPPLASVIIPSRDRLDLIAPACRGVLDATDYPSLELIVVDNGSIDPAVLAFYEELGRDPRVRIVPFPHPFNFSAMVNAGVEAATGRVVVLLNNDIGVRGAGWLGEMVRQALRPEVGAVGAKLLFGDGTLQHAGVVVGLAGRAGHILRRRPADTPGHLGRLRVAHEVSAVTAACLAVTRDKYRAVGGFDAEAFPVDFNDVDFCLRLGAAGWKCIWTPAAELYHFESFSRGPSVGAKRERFEREAARFTERWLQVIRHDPFYHPALSLTTFGEDLE